MKRFYCEVCKKIKHVQKWPVDIMNKESTIPAKRVGQCNHHVNTHRWNESNRQLTGVR